MFFRTPKINPIQSPPHTQLDVKITTQMMKNKLSSLKQSPKMIGTRYNLTQLHKNLLKELAHYYKCSQSAVIGMLIEEEAKREGITAKAKEVKPKEVSPLYDKEVCEEWLKENQSYSNNVFL